MENKIILRQKIQKKRDRQSVHTRIAASKKIASKFFRIKDYISARNILIFYPFRSEVNTTFIIEKALADGKRIILPKVEDKKLELYFVENTRIQLKSGTFGIMEPVPKVCRKAKINEIDLAVIPGVCFDSKMNRLGYGGGFYDKLIPLLKEDVKKIAICFELQMVPSIPCQSHDRKVDYIITEVKTYK